MTTDQTERSPAFLEIEAGIHAESVDWVLERLGEVATVDEVKELRRIEKKHPTFKGGRSGVLDALEERKGELAIAESGEPISAGTARGPRPAGPDDAAALTTAGAVGEDEQLPDGELEELDPEDLDDELEDELDEPARPDTEPTTAGEDLDETPDDAATAGGTRPTVGRQVHYVAEEGGPVMAATVVRVHSAVLVDLIVLIPRAHNPSVFADAVKYDADGASQSWHWPDRD